MKPKSGGADLIPCKDVVGAKDTCGSHCWPNCPTITSIKDVPSNYMFNHYLTIPEGKECYIASWDYGKFDAYLSKHTKLEV